MFIPPVFIPMKLIEYQWRVDMRSVSVLKHTLFVRVKWVTFGRLGLALVVVEGLTL